MSLTNFYEDVMIMINNVHGGNNYYTKIIYDTAMVNAHGVVIMKRPWSMHTEM